METQTAMPPQETLERTAIEAWIYRQAAALEARDASSLGVELAPEVYLVWPTVQWQGRGQVQAALVDHLAAWRAVRLHLRRLLIDVVQQAAAVEWVCHYAAHNEESYREVLGGTTLDFDASGQLRHSHTYLDPVRSRVVSELDAPWPPEEWSPSSNPGSPPGRAAAGQLIAANARAWSSHDLAQLQAVFHDEICICPPWDYQRGRAAAAQAAQIYFANYRDTQVTPRRLIIDPDQPYFGVCEQSFACTNPETGRRGEDSDFAFFEIAQGRLRYWRTYFDVSRSAQVMEKTAGFVLKQAG